MVKPMQPSFEIRVAILYHCHKKSRPLFIGELASDIGWSIERTESYVEYMILNGEIRNASPEEIKKMACIDSARLCTIIGSSDPKYSHKP